MFMIIDAEIPLKYILGHFSAVAILEILLIFFWILPCRLFSTLCFSIFRLFSIIFTFSGFYCHVKKCNILTFDFFFTISGDTFLTPRVLDPVLRLSLIFEVIVMGVRI